MSPHLPYAEHEDDEFLHPTLGWLLVVRAIAYDGWIHWRHALPRDRVGRERLNEPAAQAITRLATAIDRVHQRVPGYQQLDRSPFVFHRWWDPRGADQWSSGESCLFQLDGISAHGFASCRQPHDPVALYPQENGCIHAFLVSTAATAPPGPAAAGERRPSPGGPRRRQSPPAQTPDCAPAVPGLELE